MAPRDVIVVIIVIPTQSAVVARLTVCKTTDHNGLNIQVRSEYANTVRVFFCISEVSLHRVPLHRVLHMQPIGGVAKLVPSHTARSNAHPT